MIPARWIPDCQGKQGFDGTLVRVSTRYWPRGGSYDVFIYNRLVSVSSDPDRQRRVPPSAKSEIQLVLSVIDDSMETETLATADFEGETETDVKAQVEAWATVQYERLCAAVRDAFKRPLDAPTADR